jgi:two-component system, sensor histidine kinase and response regulator
METLRILVVDDEPGMRLAVTRALRDFTLYVPDVNIDVSFDVEEAESGEQALEKIAAAPPHILLLDYKLPGISGLEVLEKVLPEPGDLVVVMITAYASLETAITATKRGAYDFLAKPFTPEELKSTIRKAAGRVILIRQARKLAQEKRQVRFQFISVLAHELKAPLNAIEGYLNIMADRSAGEDPAVYQNMVTRSLVRAEHMRKLVMDLLDMTRIESGKKKRELSEVDLTEVAQAAIETVKAEAEGRKIAVTLHADHPVKLLADRGEMEIVFNNLITNAVKYNQDGGRVDIRLKPGEGETEIKVADTGIGLSAEDAARLFGEFVRIKNEKTRNILGSGLGLAIVKKIAQLYNGEVAVKSKVGEGSTFTVTLRETSLEVTPASPTVEDEGDRAGEKYEIQRAP